MKSLGTRCIQWQGLEKKMKTILKWYIGHVDIFPASCILYVGTLLSFPKLIPSLNICRYALRRWIRRRLGTSWHIGSWEHLFHLLSSCKTCFVIMDIETLYFSCIIILYADTRIYHMLGRRSIRSCYVFIFHFSSIYVIEVWQPDLWVCSPKLIYVLGYVYFHLRC